MLTGHIPYDGDSAVTIALQAFPKPSHRFWQRTVTFPSLGKRGYSSNSQKLENRYNSTLEMSRDLVTSLHLVIDAMPKVVFDDMTDTRPLRLIQFHQQALRKRPFFAEPSESNKPK